MKLQLAYDLGTYEELYPFMEEIEEAVDIIEIGTPVILREGVSQIENVKRRFPDKLIFADLKIMDYHHPIIGYLHQSIRLSQHYIIYQLRYHIHIQHLLTKG